MRRKLMIRLLSVLLLFLLPLDNPSAQTTSSGGLTGVVMDPSNAVVPDVDVEIRDNAKGAIQTTTTDGVPLLLSIPG